MRRPLIRPIAAASALAVASSSFVAVGADDAAVRAHARYDAGTQAFALGRFVEAALAFEAAATEKPSAIALYTAALSWERTNAPERAADDYTRALAIGGLPADSNGQAVARLATLEAVLGAVLVTGPPRSRAQLDANTELPLPATLHASPGVHTLDFHPVDGPLARLPVVLQAGVTGALALPPAETSSEAPRSKPEAHVSTLRPALGLVTLGAGGGALVSAVLLGVEALNARDAYAAGPTLASYDHARNLARWTDAAWLAGGTLFAGGLVLVLWPSTPGGTNLVGRSGLRVAIGPSCVGLRGGF